MKGKTRYIAPPLALKNLQEQAKEALTDSVCNYRVSSYSFRGNYSFLEVEMRQVFKGGSYCFSWGFFLYKET